MPSVVSETSSSRMGASSGVSGKEAVSRDHGEGCCAGDHSGSRERAELWSESGDAEKEEAVGSAGGQKGDSEMTGLCLGTWTEGAAID